MDEGKEEVRNQMRGCSFANILDWTYDPRNRDHPLLTAQNLQLTARLSRRGGPSIGREEAVPRRKAAVSCLFTQQVTHKWIFNFQRVET